MGILSLELLLVRRKRNIECCFLFPFNFIILSKSFVCSSNFFLSFCLTFEAVFFFHHNYHLILHFDYAFSF